MTNRIIKFSDYSVENGSNSLLFVAELLSGEVISFPESGKLHFLDLREFISKTDSDRVISLVAQILKLCDVFTSFRPSKLLENEAAVASLDESGSLRVEIATVLPFSDEEFTTVMSTVAPD